MTLGIMDTVGLAATLIFAAPVGVFGVEKLLAGDAVLGGLLVLVAVLMVVLPQRLTTPTDLPGAVAGKAVEKAVVTDDED
jgi:hypothetical protein